MTPKTSIVVAIAVVIAIVSGVTGYFTGVSTVSPAVKTVTYTYTVPYTYTTTYATTYTVTVTLTPTLTPSPTPSPTPTPTPMPSPTPSPTPTPTPKPSPTPSVVYKEIDTLIISQRADLSTIDVQVATDAPTLTVFSHVYETLFRLVFDKEMKPKFVPHLVESYRQINETAYEFKLRSGIKFHDGTPLTAYDVKASFERGPKVGGLPRILLGPVKSVDVVDELTFILQLKYPFVPIIAHLAHPSTVIIPRKVAELFPDKPIDDVKHIIGTGPFRFIEFSKGVRTVLEKFEDYWSEKPTVKKIVWRPIPDDDARVAALEAGDVDIITHVPPHMVALLKEKKLNVIQIPSTRVIYIGINVERIPDAKVRKALNYAVDKEAIVKEILENAATVADAPIPPTVFGYSKQSVYEYNLEKARKLLEEAGWIGKEIVFTSPHGRYLKDREIAEAIQGFLQAIGLNVKLEIEPDWAKYIDRVMKQKDFDLFLLGWSTVTLDADYGLYSLFRSGAPFNRMQYINEKVDMFLDQARAESDLVKRAQLYAEAISIIWDDAPWIFLHIEDIIVATKPNIVDVEIQPIERWIVTYAKVLASS